MKMNYVMKCVIKETKIEHLIKNLSYKIKFDKCVVTRGASGAIMYDKNKKPFIAAQHLQVK